MSKTQDSDSMVSGEYGSVRPRARALPWLLFVLLLVISGAGLYYGLQERHEQIASLAAASLHGEELQRQLDRVGPELERLKSEKVELLAAKDELSKDVAAKSSELER